VSGSFFSTLGVRPYLGRLLQPDDDRPHGPRVVVLSYRLWQTRFGSDAGVIGTTISGDGRPATVVGVAPPEFDFPRGTQLWLPVAPLLTEGALGLAGLHQIGVLFVIGRFNANATHDAAARELDELARQAHEQGATRFGSGVRVTPFLEYLFGPLRQALWWLLAAVLVLLVIACGNLSALSLTRRVRQRRQQAIRLALGADSGALLRPMLVEALLISGCAVTVGLMASRVVLDALMALAPSDLANVTQVAISREVGLVAVAVSLAATWASCTLPMRRASMLTVDDLHDSARATDGPRAMRLRSLLLKGQVALTVVLLAAAGLILRSYSNLRQIDLGFEPANVVTIELEPQQSTLPANEWMRELLTRVDGLPGIEAAGAVYLRPLALGGIGADTRFLLEGQPATKEQEARQGHLNYQSATSGYFRAMGIQLVEGRVFEPADHARSPRVAVISESAARMLWPGKSALGRRLRLPSMDPDFEIIWRTVVGVVSDVRYRRLDDVRNDVYEPASQARALAGHVVVRSQRNPVAIAAAVQAEARRMDPAVLIGSASSLDAIVSRAMAPWRLSVWLFTAFALMALVLSAVGLFALAALDVSQRTREFALRKALGARTRDIVRKVLTSTGSHALAGLVAGLAVAATVSQWMSSLLFHTDPLDPITYGVVTVTILLSVAAAALIPAYRASRTDPAILLRQD
jgi:predicted permease